MTGAVRKRFNVQRLRRASTESKEYSRTDGTRAGDVELVGADRRADVEAARGRGEPESVASMNEQTYSTSSSTVTQSYPQMSRIGTSPPFEYVYQSQSRPTTAMTLR